MLIYILDPFSFDRVAVIEEYESCIWTERFVDPGDFTLVVPQTGPNVELLVGGTVLENEESDRPMFIEGLELKDGTLICTGRTLEAFFNQRSLAPIDNADDTAYSPEYFDSPGNILAEIVDDMQAGSDFGGYLDFPITIATNHSWDPQPQADGDDVWVKVNKREKVHDLLVRLARQYNIDMRVKRIFELGYMRLGFTTRNTVDRTSTNDEGNSTVRFSPDDDNLIDVHEVYSAEWDIVVSVVHIPRHFSADGQLGAFQDSIMYGRVDGEDTFLDSFDDLNLPAFQTRIVENDGESLTLDWLKSQLFMYYDVLEIPTWESLTFSEQQDILFGEMKRLAITEYKKAKGKRIHAIDGEVTSSVFRYGIEYKLGDKVEIASGLRANIPYSIDEKIVTEFIRSLDESGYRAYPTLTSPLTPVEYPEHDDDVDHPDYPDSDNEDHTFSITGPLPIAITALSPHKVYVKPGETKQLISISQSGPTSGTCTLKFELNGEVIHSWDLPIVLSHGDEITIDPSTHSSDAATVSGHFTIRIIKAK